MSEDLGIPPQYHIAQTSGWSVNHRINSALPGYVMIASTQSTNELGDLSAEALGLMGTVFAKVQRALSALGARRVYIGRYGHSPGYPIHFRAIPTASGLKTSSEGHRYRVLKQFADGPGETPSDGAELTWFVWREFCERADPPPIKGPSVSETIAILRQVIQFS